MDGLRSLLSGLLLVAATVLAVVAIGASWARHQLLNTDVWTGHAVAVVHDPAVERVTARFLAEQVVAQQAAARDARDLLPAQLQALADAPAAKAERVVERVALQAIRSGTLDDAWERTMRDTHEQFVAWIAGGEHGDDAQMGVDLDLEPIVAQTAREAGVPDAVVEIGADQVQATVSLVRGGQYATARQDANWLIDRADQVAPLAVLLAVLSVAFAHRRKWAVVRVGVGAALAGLVVVAAASAIGDHFIDALAGDGAAPAVAGAIWDATGPPLTQLGWIVAAAGVGLALLAVVLWREPAVRAPQGTDPRWA